MKIIPEFEEIYFNKKTPRANGINPNLYYSYIRCRENDMDRLYIEATIADAEEIREQIRKYKIEKWAAPEELERLIRKGEH